MNLILLDREELDARGHVVLTDRRAEHLRRIIDVRVGQTVRAGIVRGPLAIATIVAVDGGVELAVETAGEPREDPCVELVMAVPRPKALPRIVQAAASFGIRRLDLINAWRVDSSYFSSHKVEPELLMLDARLGCEQGRQTYIPAIDVHRLFVPFVEQELRPRLVADGLRLLIAHPGAAHGIEQLYNPGTRQRTVVAIGPDGGFIDRELDCLTAAGGTVVHFGPAVLRSEVAVVAILSQLDLLRRLSSDLDPTT